MDKLLQKLRQNMAELSLQGDDFTRQIWQMYATFEEFIDHQQSPGATSPPRHAPRDAPPPPPAPSGGLGTTPTLSSHPRDAPPSSSSSSASSAAPFCRMSPAAMAALTPVTAARDDLALASPRRSRRRRPRRLRRSVDNPLLDTISAIGGDSDDDLAPPPHHAHYYAHHHAHSCTRLHPEADLIGYAGSNSVDSGYKSACPTPDPPTDPSYPEHRLEKRGSLASLASSGSSGGSNAGSKPRIAMGTRVMSRGGGVPRSPGTGGGITPTRRPGSDGTYYESDQLAALRQALLGSPPTDPDSRTSRYSPRVSPATLPLNTGASPRDIHVSRRAASPASPERRPRSASTGSRCSPGPRGTRKTLPAGSPLLASTGSLPRASSPSRRPSLSPAGRDDVRPPPAWSRHSSPGMGAPAGRGRRPPSPIVGVDQDRENELALLEREIDVLLYGGRVGGVGGVSGAQYYDLESGREFPCPFGGVQDAHSCRPALASVRRLREDLPEMIISSSANEVFLVGASDGVEGTIAQQPPPPPPPPLAPPLLPTPPPTSTTFSSGTCSSSDCSAASSPRTPSSHSSFTFCSSEIAKCVLSMLDDFPPKTNVSTTVTDVPSHLPNPQLYSSFASKGLKATDILGMGVLKELKKSSARKKQRYRTTPYPRESLNDEIEENELMDCPMSCSGSNCSTSCSSSSTSPDYHLYEEIVYETSDKPPAKIPRPPSPPPLPDRPPLILKAALESLRLENKNSQPMKVETPKEPILTVVPSLPAFICCRCPCEFTPRKQIVQDEEESEPQTGAESPIPPTPPLRSTSQMTLGSFLPRNPKPHIPVMSGETLSADSLPNLSHFNPRGPLPSPPSVPILMEASPNPACCNMPIPPPRKSSKNCHILSIAKEEPTGNGHIQKEKERFSVCDIDLNKALPPDPLVSNSGKPKQRNNLYSIFKDRHHRRFLSASLELEYHQQPGTASSTNEKSRKCKTCCLLPPLLPEEGNCFPLTLTKEGSDPTLSPKGETAGSNRTISTSCSSQTHDPATDTLSSGAGGSCNSLPPSSESSRNSCEPLASQGTSVSSSSLMTTKTSSGASSSALTISDKTTKTKRLSVGKSSSCSRPLPTRVSTSTCHMVACSLDIGRGLPTEDDYGFQALPNAV